MKGADRGFTLLEVVVALVIVGVLAGMLMLGLGLSRGVLAVDSARSAFMSMHSHARALAIQQGGSVRLRVSAASERAWVEAGGVTHQSVDFTSRFGVSIEGLPGELTVCINSRGYAEPACNNFGSAATVTFVAGGESAGVKIYPLGLVVTS